jgi:dTDP-glucose 4,6-dehydratase
MKYLVTGGAGFIGSEFVRHLVKKNEEVIVVDCLTYAGDFKRLESVKDKIIFYQVDITDKVSLEKIFLQHKPNIVVHFAAESHVDRSIIEPLSFIKTNVEGTFNLLDLSRKFNVEKFINISTDEVYGEIKEGSFKEESPLCPSSPYSASKAAQDLLAKAYIRTYDLPVIIIRPSNNYGAWQYPEKFIPVVIYKAIKEQSIPIYGTGENIRQWLYVEDCVDGILQIIEKGKISETYNIASKDELKNIDVAKYILKILNKTDKLLTFIKDRPGHDFRYSIDTTKVQKEIGWQQKTSFQEGIKKTVDWYIKNFDWLEEKVQYLQDYWKKIYG